MGKLNFTGTVLPTYLRISNLLMKYLFWLCSTHVLACIKHLPTYFTQCIFHWKHLYLVNYRSHIKKKFRTLRFCIFFVFDPLNCSFRVCSSNWKPAHLIHTLQNLAHCPEDESVILSSLYNTIAGLSIKQGKVFDWINRNHAIFNDGIHRPLS